MAKTELINSAAKRALEKERRAQLGKKIVAVHRHSTHHALDKGCKDIKSHKFKNSSGEALPIWPYTRQEVTILLKTSFSMFLVQSMESFLDEDLWDDLCIDNCWFRNLTPMGGVPEPSAVEKIAIAKAGPYYQRTL
jgi:hypothetical protein